MKHLLRYLEQKAHLHEDWKDWDMGFAPKALICIPMLGEPKPEMPLSSLRGDIEKVGVIVVINHKKSASKEIKQANEYTFERLCRFREQHPAIRLKIIRAYDVEDKIAGVGWARKLAMDAAVSHFSLRHNPHGLIVALDGDCEVEEGYVSGLLELAKANKDKAFSFHFEHPFHEEKAIMEYELHLRLYKHLLAWAGHPHSQYTVGSSMACSAQAYARHGGMNRRKAGEDFYFLQKFIQAGHWEYYPKSVVLPSGRFSDRVPFGTGRAMLQHADGQEIKTYNFKSYLVVEQFIKYALSCFDQNTTYTYPVELSGAFAQNKVDVALEMCQRSVSDHTAYPKRFFQWFDAFKAMKMLHHLRDECGLPSQSGKACVEAWVESRWLPEGYLGVKKIESRTTYSLLQYFRKLDRGN